MNDTETINVIPEIDSMVKVKESLKQNEDHSIELSITNYE